MKLNRKLPWDWYDGCLPDNVLLEEGAYIESAFSFYSFRSKMACGARLERGAAAYLGTMFNVGPRGKVSLGQYSMIHGAHIICDEEISIGDYTMISWNVVLMDTWRLSVDPAVRRRELEGLAQRSPRVMDTQAPTRPIRIEAKAWIGFDVCILPGVTIGEGAIVGARSVVSEDVPPYCVVAGNPARVIRERNPAENQNHVDFY